MNMDAFKFSIGQKVWFAIGEHEGIVTAIIFRQEGVLYRVIWDDFEERAHYECELRSERPTVSP